MRADSHEAPLGATDARRDGAIRDRLGAWFDGAARDLPWRRTRDAYAVWLSEIMLQQTRVQTVIPYYERFLARFPHVHALAEAPIDEVLSLWSGLGYYRRARVLHAAAREVVERHAGVFPREAAELRALPGVGEYTAGAIGSIAFDRPVPLVDGNVARVLARLEAIDADTTSGAGKRAAWAAAERLVPDDRPGRFNQALMELGATVCVPRAPRCDECPLRARCVAHATGRQLELPRVAPRRPRPEIRAVAAVVRHGDRVLLARRAEGGLFGGLWEPPLVEAKSIEEARPLLARASVPASARLGRAGSVRHVLTHRELAVDVFAAVVERAWRLRSPTQPPYERAAWIDPRDAAVGVSTLARRVLAAADPSR